jgi:hypothetical protein
MSEATNPKFTAQISPGCGETPKNLAQIRQGNARNLVAKLEATARPDIRRRCDPRSLALERTGNDALKSRRPPRSKLALP